jgi:hypothetical protein
MRRSPGEADAGAPRVAQDADRETGSHTDGGGEDEVVGAGGPAQRVIADGTGAFEAGAEDIHLAGVAPAGQELPLHLGGESLLTGVTGLEAEVGVAVRGGELRVPRRSLRAGAQVGHRWQGGQAVVGEQE